MRKLVDWSTIDWKVWKPRLLYGAFVLLAFVLSLRLTFPSGAVKERLIYEAGTQGWQIDMSSIELGGFLGIHAQDVRLEDRTGLQVPLDELTATLSPLHLLVGRRVVNFDARVYGGRIDGTAALSGAERPVRIRLTDLDLGQAVRVRQATGVQLQGKAQGDVDVVLGAGGMPSGHLSLNVTGLDVAGAQVPVPGMGSGLPLPRLALGTVTVAVAMEGGKATAQKLQARGGDAELTADGAYAVLQPRLEYAPLAGKVQLKLQPAFWAKKETSSLKPLVENALASSRTPDGAYAFQLYGSLGHPQLRPVPGMGGEP